MCINNYIILNVALLSNLKIDFVLKVNMIHISRIYQSYIPKVMSDYMS